MRIPKPWLAAIAAFTTSSCAAPEEEKLAPHWGSFGGHDERHHAVAMIVTDVVAMSPDQSTETLEVVVLTVNPDLPANWQADTCHRTVKEPYLLWCDGNEQSPLFNSRYRLLDFKNSPASEFSQQQRWEKIPDNNPYAPDDLLYER